MSYTIEAAHIDVAPSAQIGDGVRIRGERVAIGPDVVIADGADINCDTLTLGTGCRMSTGTRITCPEITWAEGCSTGRDFTAELNVHFRMERHSTIANRVQMAGQGFQSGEFFWARDEVVVGGGGNKGPDSYCYIGDRVMLVDRCFLNISERITIGDDCGFSTNVILLTHASGQPALMGYKWIFAPITVGECVNITLNCVVLPGVTIGAYSMIAAGSVVIRDVPPHCMVAGVPAVVKAENYPPPLSRGEQDELILPTLKDYAVTLPPKGIEITDNRVGDAGWFSGVYAGETWRVGFGQPDSGHSGPQLSLDFAPAALKRADDSHFNLSNYQVTGAESALMEDLRDYLRRRAIRFSTDRPFRSIPLANLKRLKSRA